MATKSRKSKKSAKARFRRLVNAKVDKGMSRRDAVRATVKRNPRLRKAMLAEANPGEGVPGKELELSDDEALERFRRLVEQMMEEEDIDRREAIRRVNREFPEVTKFVRCAATMKAETKLRKSR